MNAADTQTRVIQCPSCQTKFAVKASMVAASNFPRFHCSRCDHVFSLEQQMEMPLETFLENDPVDQPSAASFESSGSSDWTTGDAQDFHQTSDAPAREESASSAYSSVEIPSFESIMEDDPQPEPMQEDPTPDLQINRMNTAKTAEMPGTVRKEALDQMDMLLNPRTRRPRNGGAAPEPQAEEGRVTGSEPAAEPDPETKQKRSARTKSDDWRIDAPVEDTLASETLSSDTLGGSTLQQSASAAAKFGRWKSAATLGAPLLGFLAILLLAGFVLSQNPETAWALGNSLTGSTTRVAPPGLYMSDVSHQETELESGELVHVISGTVHNDTSETFTTLTLEGLTFSSTGKLLSRTLVPANSTLGKTRIKSLSLEMIRNLQETARTARFALAPNETQDFTIAIIHEEPVNVSYYSARVYSVNQSR